ncbi:Very-long-chain 3-oxoacyl-CoA reductase [Eumeta japonica]|uniref:Very-long-chain 3-oxoacyl-CoA reductase n=1 Tax=Eumeta variegata TaxID=151549 RepID=A0A4C1UYL4_EUMVA|nr:Very-long-chain 3-oxoacyl-CoA reductase [Eumeta japonica]
MNSLIKVNVLSMIRMNGLILPGMVKRGRGVIINIGSLASIVPCPLAAVYGATKAFVDKLSQTLEMEYSKDGIIVQAVNPGYVLSNMTPHLERSSLFAPTAEQFVRSALSTVNVVSRTTGYLPHDISVCVVDCMRAVSERFTAWATIKMMERTRDKVLKKSKTK